MTVGTVYLERIPPAALTILDTVPLSAQELAFAGGTAAEVVRRIADHPGRKNHHLFLIRSGDAAVGFLCLRDGDAKPDWAPEDAVTLHNFRIGLPWRGQGFGRAAMLACRRRVLDHHPEALRLDMAVNEANTHAIGFYASCGFSPTGAVHAGRLGREIIMSLRVERPSSSSA